MSDIAENDFEFLERMKIQTFWSEAAGGMMIPDFRRLSTLARRGAEQATARNAALEEAAMVPHRLFNARAMASERRAAEAIEAAIRALKDKP